MQKDIVIIGAGPAGLSFARLIANTGLSVLLLDQQQQEAIAEPAFDGRDIALTHQSKQTLQHMGVWERFAADEIHPLKDAKVRNGHSPFALHFQRNDHSDQPLGYLIANWVIRRELYQEVISHNNIALQCNARVTAIHAENNNACVTYQTDSDAAETHIETRLVIAADNRFSTARRMMGIGASMTDFGRVMIVTNMCHQKSHEHTAQEFFAYGRTCAILPLAEGVSSIVITVPASQSHDLLALDENAFNIKAEELLEGRLGKMELISERHAYPLIGVYAHQFIASRFALIGDAAVGMHPVTAHGFNLGLSSAATLSQLILKAQSRNRDMLQQRSLDSLLRQYQWQHRLQSRPLYEATNAIVKLFTDDRKLARLARSAAIKIGDNFLPFKKLIAHRLTKTQDKNLTQ